MSRRLAGLPPEFSELNLRNVKRPLAVEPSSLFMRNQKRVKPSSEPIQEIQKMPTAVPFKVAIEELEEVIPLSKTDILQILSREMPMEKASILEKFMNKSNIKNQEVPCVYSSYFFRKDIIKEFQRDVINKISVDKLANFPLSTYNLYNKDDILNNTTYRPDIIGSRNIEKTLGYQASSIKNMKQFITFLSKRVCSDIKPYYAKSAVERAIDLTKNEVNFDILVASTRIIEDVSLPIERRLEGVVAFVIVELGECKKYPTSYSINLICTNTEKAISGTGSILMGAFLYTILSHPNNLNPIKKINFPKGKGYLKVTSKKQSDGKIFENCTFGSSEPLIPVQQIAVLELASAYANPGGLCMYEKFGFTYDQTMFSDDSKGIDCFSDRDNLPMLIDFNSKPGYSELDNAGKKQKVVNITAGADRGFPKSKICSLRGDYQKLLGMVKSIKLYIDNEEGSSLDDFPPKNPYGILIKQIKDMHIIPNHNHKVGSITSLTPAALEGTIDEVIDYLENPPQPEDTELKRKIDNLLQYLPVDKKKTTGGSKKLRRKITRRYTKKRN